MHNISESDYAELKKAKHLLENTSLAGRLTDLIGRPMDWAVRQLPEGAQGQIVKVSRETLEKITDMACWTLGENGKSWKTGHMLGAMCSGGIGGAFGLAALPFELPISTTIILRSVASIARSEGECLADPESRLACVEVFALGGRTQDDDSMDSAYLILRAMLAQEMRQAGAFLAANAARRETPPVIIRFIQTVATRFSVVVEEKVAAQLLPVIGAVGGAGINALFIDHFQDKAAGHFVFRRLERKYGADQIEAAYREI